MRTFLRLAAVVVVGTISSRALADEPPGNGGADNRARAQQLFDSALADAEAGNFAAACPKFQASQDADPKTSTLLNLGACYEKNSQTASAWGAFREAQLLARRIGRTDWETNARARAEALEPRLVRLTVVVPLASAAPGLVVTRDGMKLGAGEYGVAIPVDPGDHLVRVTADGKTPWETRSSVREASVVVTVPSLVDVPKERSPVPLASPPPQERVVQREWWTPLRTGGVIGIGVGGAALVTGAVLGFVAKGNHDDAKAQCQRADLTACPPDSVASGESAQSLAGVATGVFVAGAVLAAAGVAVVLVAPNASGSTSKRGALRLGLGAMEGTF